MSTGRPLKDKLIEEMQPIIEKEIGTYSNDLTRSISERVAKRCAEAAIKHLPQCVKVEDLKRLISEYEEMNRMGDGFNGFSVVEQLKELLPEPPKE